MSSSLYFFANSMNPFIGRLGLSGSLSFLVEEAPAIAPVVFAGDIGGDIMPLPLVPPDEDDTATMAVVSKTPRCFVSGCCCCCCCGVWTPMAAAAVVVGVDPNSNLRNLSHRSGVRTASG